MLFLRRYFDHPEFRRGLRDMVPQAPGLAAWGMMTGVAMVNSGMEVTSALLMTLLVYAGSAQLAAIPLIAAGAPMAVIFSIAFCLNLRFVVFSLHLRPYFAHLPLHQRLIFGYLTGDLSYVMFVKRFPHADPSLEKREEQIAYFVGGSCVNWASWMIPSLAGIVLANFIAPSWGLGFAGTLCLIGILCSLATTKLRLLAAVVATSATVAAYAMPFKLYIVAAITAAVMLCLAVEERRAR